MPKKAFLYSDGGARGNPGPAAIGVLLTDRQGKILREHHEVIGETTNNVAEYTAILVGLEIARALGVEEIEYYGDSQLAVNQLSGEFRVKTPHILSLFNQVKNLEKFFKKITYRQVPRTHEKIRYVDKLVNRALDMQTYQD